MGKNLMVSFDDLSRVPLFPTGGVRSDRRVAEVFQGCDIATTLLSASGAELAALLHEIRRVPDLPAATS